MGDLGPLDRRILGAFSVPPAVLGEPPAARPSAAVARVLRMIELGFFHTGGRFSHLDREAALRALADAQSPGAEQDCRVVAAGRVACVLLPPHRQAELATAIGVGRTSVVRYEAGRSAPSRPVLLAWATRTGVSLEWLAGE